MGDKDMENYSIFSMEEPSDEWLHMIMKEAVEDANRKWEKAFADFNRKLLHLDGNTSEGPVRDSKANYVPEHRPLLIVIGGPNGSGKTTITDKVLHHGWRENAIYINPDSVAKDKFGDWNSPDAVLKAAKYCTELRYECLSSHRSMIFETVLSSAEKVDFIMKAKAEGYFIRLFFISTESPTINAARIVKRYMEGGHSVPIEKVVSRFQRSIDNCRVLSKLVDRCYVYDNSVDGQEARLLFRLSEGELVKQYPGEIPSWAKNIL